MKNEALFFYILLALSGIAVIASILTLNIFVIAISVILIFASVVVYKLWYVIDSLVFKHTNLIELFNGYELSKDRNSAIRRKDGRIISTTAALLSAEKEESIEKGDIENIIAHINYPFKFVMQVEKLNVHRIMDRLQTERSLKEIELSRLDNNKSSVRINQLRRELELIQHDMNAIKTGDTPIKLTRYILTTSVSDTFYDAEERAKSQIRELSSQFDALLKSNSRIIVGTELIELLQLDSEMVSG
jgi:hypothetical protein